jgi:hypothetical protein
VSFDRFREQDQRARQILHDIERKVAEMNMLAPVCRLGRPQGAMRVLVVFALLKIQNDQGFTLAEIPESPDPERVLRYFRSLWLAYQPRE